MQKRKLEDVFAEFIGSWRFIIMMTVILFLWVFYNVWLAIRVFHAEPFDPYPFIFLNLALSFFAAYSSPIILMSQNSQKKRDDAKSERQEQMVEAIYHMAKGQHKMLDIIVRQEANNDERKDG